MATKNQILDRVRNALADRKTDQTVMPPPPEVWPVEGISLDEMKTRFRTNLESVKGEFVSCGDLDEAARKITVLLDELGARTISLLDRPLSRRVAEQLDHRETIVAPDNPGDASPEVLEKVDVGLVSPEYLLADTGSCLFHAPTAFDRLITYISPVSLVVASTSMLRENMPALWTEMKPRLESSTTGEFVLVTGPSRTADIEKILILGVHGPKRLVVFLIDEEGV